MARPSVRTDLSMESFNMTNDIDLACRKGKECPDLCVKIDGKTAIVCMGQIAIDVETGDILKAALMTREGTLIRMVQYKGKNGWEPIVGPLTVQSKGTGRA